MFVIALEEMHLSMIFYENWECWLDFSALRNGGRYKWLWLTCILQGLTTEMVSYFLPDIDNFWHAQGMVMFAGQRLPLYIMVLCKSFHFKRLLSHILKKWNKCPSSFILQKITLIYNQLTRGKVQYLNLSCSK